MPGNNFATLSLVFIDAPELKQIAELMHTELNGWLARYPVLVMVTAFDIEENVLRPETGGHLVGWVAPNSQKVVTSWNIEELSNFIKANPANQNWETIYTNIPYKTQNQIKIEADNYIKERRRINLGLKLILTLWIAVLPASWAIVQYLGPDWLGLLVLIYALYKIATAWTKLMGYRKPSSAEKEKLESERKMRHYAYHCELNPTGFARLKAENLGKEIAAQNLTESKNL